MAGDAHLEVCDHCAMIKLVDLSHCFSSWRVRPQEDQHTGPHSQTHRIIEEREEMDMARPKEFDRESSASCHIRIVSVRRISKERLPLFHVPDCGYLTNFNNCATQQSRWYRRSGRPVPISIAPSIALKYLAVTHSCHAPSFANWLNFLRPIDLPQLVACCG